MKIITVGTQLTLISKFISRATDAGLTGISGCGIRDEFIISPADHATKCRREKVFSGRKGLCRRELHDRFFNTRFYLQSLTHGALRLLMTSCIELLISQSGRPGVRANMADKQNKKRLYCGCSWRKTWTCDCIRKYIVSVEAMALLRRPENNTFNYCRNKTTVVDAWPRIC